MSVAVAGLDRRLLDELPDGVAFVQGERISYVNRAFASMLGRTPDETVGLPMLELVAPEDREIVLHRYWARQEGERAPVSYEVSVLRPDGSLVRIEIQPRAVGERELLVLIRDRSSALHERELLTALAELSARLHRARGVESLVAIATDGLAKLGFGAAVHRIDGEELVLGAGRGDHAGERILSQALGRPLPGTRVPIAGALRTSEALRLGRSIYDDDLLGAMMRFAENAGGSIPADVVRTVSQLRGVVSPLFVRDRAWGVLSVSSVTLDSQDAAALGLFATQLSASLEVALAIEELEGRNRELQAVQALAEAGSETELERVLPRLLAIAATSSQSDRCAIFLADESRRELQLVGTHAFPPGLASRVRRLRVDAPGDALFAPDHGRSFATGDLPEPRRSELLAAGFGENLLLSLQIKGRQSGTIWLSRGEGRAYGAGEVRSAELLAGQIAIQVESARLYSETRRRVRSLSLLFDLARAAAETEGVRALVDRVLELLTGAFPFEAIAIHLRGPGGLVLAGVRGPAASDVPELVESGLPQAAGSHAQATLKLVAREDLVGALTVLRAPDRSWLQEERQLLQSCAAQLGVAIEHARLFDELARTQAALVQRERLAALGELAALVAHEIRNPLGVIFNSLGSLRKILDLQGDARMLLDIVDEEADRLNRIVGDLLDFARPREAEPTTGAIEPVIEDALMAAVPPGVGIVVTRDVPADLPTVQVDAHMIRQALLNLMLNAVQAMPRGGRLGVQARVDGADLVLSVTDTGPGIPPEFTPRLFEPFFTTKAAGSGLGLAAVKRILDAHHGSVEAGAAPGGGARFTLRLPLRGAA